MRVSAPPGAAETLTIEMGFRARKRGTGEPVPLLQDVDQSLMFGSMNSLVTMSSGVTPSFGVAPWAS